MIASPAACTSGVEPARRRVAHAQDPVLVLVLDEGIAEDRPVDAASTAAPTARGERHECLERRAARHRGRPTPGVRRRRCARPAGPCRRSRHVRDLSTAGYPTHRVDGRTEITGALHVHHHRTTEWKCRGAANACFSVRPVLRDLERGRRRGGAHGHSLVDQELRGARRNTLPFVRDDVGGRSQPLQRRRPRCRARPRQADRALRGLHRRPGRGTGSGREAGSRPGRALRPSWPPPSTATHRGRRPGAGCRLGGGHGRKGWRWPWRRPRECSGPIGLLESGWLNASLTIMRRSTTASSP